jgi:hypothetical protein
MHQRDYFGIWGGKMHQRDHFRIWGVMIATIGKW